MSVAEGATADLLTSAIFPLTILNEGSVANPLRRAAIRTKRTVADVLVRLTIVGVRAVADVLVTASV